MQRGRGQRGDAFQESPWTGHGREEELMSMKGLGGKVYGMGRDKIKGPPKLTYDRRTDVR